MAILRLFIFCSIRTGYTNAYRVGSVTRDKRLRALFTSSTGVQGRILDFSGRLGLRLLLVFVVIYLVYYYIWTLVRASAQMWVVGGASGVMHRVLHPCCPLCYSPMASGAIETSTQLVEVRVLRRS